VGVILADEYERLAPLFVGAVFDVRVASQNVWVTDDLAAVAMWDAPGKSGAAPGHAESVCAGYHGSVGEEASDRLASYNAAIAAASPTEPHWYLGVLATRPRCQRGGRATAVLTPILEQADRLGIMCCLETSTPENRGFYERRGFTEVTPMLLPGGPVTWWLTRAGTSR
jgi:GNAT superfamily N-acetyltransferase